MADRRRAPCGVSILVGTDTLIGSFRYHDDGARYAGQGEDADTVTVGKCADLVLLKGDPLADIANLRRTRGDPGRRLYDRARLDALLALVRGQAGRCMSGRSCFGLCVQFGEGRPA